MDIVMPRLGDTMEEGTVVRWHKAVGDTVNKGDILCEIETDKLPVDFEAETAGRLTMIYVQAGSTVAIGTPIAKIDT
jgi:pyruvate dehydrogenase E2 component (dihydrolipoamide acetyltransferase)